MKPLLQPLLRHLHRRLQRKRERGAITVIVATLMGFGVLTGSAALVVDVGSIYLERTELQSGADAAAAALARACLATSPASTACTSGVAGLDLATEYAARNTKSATTVKREGESEAIEKSAAAYRVCGVWAGRLESCSAPTRPDGTLMPNGALSSCVGAAPLSDFVEVWVQLTTSDDKNLLPPSFSRSLYGNADFEGTAITACSRVTKATYRAQQTASPTPTTTASSPPPSVVVPTPTATTPTATPTATTPPANQCVRASSATYRHTFDGPRGIATIKPDKPLCPGETQPVTLVSYTAPDKNFALPQFVYGVDMKTIDSTTSTSSGLSFTVAVPGCYTQVDFVFRSSPINPLDNANNLYNDLKIGSANGLGSRSVGVQGWYNSGTKLCAPKPTSSVATTCTGLTITLANGSTANIDGSFTITTSGGTQYIRVAKGTNTVITVASAVAANGVTIKDNLFTSSTQTWTKPKKGC